jgi:hypothetical protein
MLVPELLDTVPCFSFVSLLPWPITMAQSNLQSAGELAVHQICYPGQNGRELQKQLAMESEVSFDSRIETSECSPEFRKIMIPQ